MKTLGLLFVLVGLLLAVLALPIVATAQDADAPEGARIDGAEVSGLPLADLSPGLRQAIEALAGTPLGLERVRELAARIEGEQPEVVVAVRAILRPNGEAHVVFFVARISDDLDLSANINARYVVERVELSGVADDAISQELRDALQTLVGKRLDSSESDRLSERLKSELPNHDVRRRIAKGSEPGRIRVIFEVTRIDNPWIPFTPSRSKIVYHGDQGWSGALDIPIGADVHRFTAGFAFGNKDDLLEEYSGFRLRVESRRLATDRLGASLEVARFNQTWEPATLAAAASNLPIADPYRTRVTVEPSVTVAFHPNLRLTAGASISELESLSGSPRSVMANAAVVTVGAGGQWGGGAGEQRLEASYEVRAAREGLDSDLVYTRHLGRARYRYTVGPSTVIASTALGSISGTAPLFERFSLGDSSTLRGWNKFDIAPAGGGRMFHESLEYRFHGAALFFDVGSVWDRATDRRVRLSTGFGFHSDFSFITLGIPLNAEGAGVTFMAGVRF
jgi:hypothetical protein